jgi:phosphoglycerate dehydrogenase-like enzyme
MQKMVFLSGLEDKYRDRLQLEAPGWVIADGRLSASPAEDCADAEIIVGWNRQAEQIGLAPGTSLRWIQSFGAGVDGMPLAILKARGIYLTNASGVHPFPISETIFGLMLAFARQIGHYVRNQAGRVWQHDLRLSEIHGKTIAILGVGAIGEETARLARAFGMRVLGVRRSGQPSPFVDTMYDTGRLAEPLAQADFVVNILPLTQETRQLIGSAELALMKADAIYINVGRGETTDTAALIQALRENRIAGAGLDVVAPEPLPAESPLWAMPNVIITPHSAGATEFYNDRVMEIFLENLAAYLASGAPIRNIVDLSLGY